MKGFGHGLIAVLILLHLLLHVGFGFGGGAPDLFVVALLVAGRMVGTGSAAGLGFTLGLLEDAFSALSFGSNALSMSITGIAASRSRDLFVADSILFLFAYFVGGKWIRELLAWLVSDATVRGGFVEHALIQAPVAGVYASLIGIAAVSVLRRRPEGWE